MALRVEIVERGGLLWSGYADYVNIPSVDGDVGVLPGRLPFLAVMRHGKVKVIPESKTEEEFFEVGGGFASVDNNNVTIVVEKDQ